MGDEEVLPAEGSGAPGPLAPAGEETREIQAPEEEARPRKEVARPVAPTQEEIDRHRVDHLPYRN